MSRLLGFSWLAFIPFHLLLGLSGMFLIEAVVAAIMLGAAATFANAKGLLPGTPSYQSRLSLEQAETNLELARINRVRTRINLLESEDVDKIMALPAPSASSE